MKNKIFTGLLTLAMVMTTSVTAFAATTPATAPGETTADTDGFSETINVQAKYEGGITIPDVISVDVVWGEMQFTYSVGGTKTWNADSHTYTNNSEAGWVSSGNTVKLTNHSNVDVKAALSFDAKTEYNGITGTFKYDNGKSAEGGVITLNAGVEYEPDVADYVNATLTLSGELASSVITSTSVGTITVTISKDSN